MNWDAIAPGGLLLATLDEELEHYRLLAYVQRVDALYQERKLFPCLEELGLRIGQLEHLVERMRGYGAVLQGELAGVDLRQGKLVRKPMPEQAWYGVMRSLGKSLPLLRSALDRGDELRGELNRSIRYGAVGVVPLRVSEGWLLLRQRNQALAYAYSVPAVRNIGPGDPYRQVRTRYHATWTISFSNTYRQIKEELARGGPWPNPAVFAFESDLSLPRIETFLPLAKQIAYELVAGAGRE